MLNTEVNRIIPNKTKTDKFKSKKKKEKFINTILFFVLLAGSLIMIVPLLWMVSTSVKNKLEKLIGVSIQKYGLRVLC